MDRVGAAVRDYQRTLARKMRPTGPKISTVYGTVTAVTPGTSATVNVQGNSIVCPYRSTYSPVVGHVVEVELRDGSPIVVDHAIGVTSV